MTSTMQVELSGQEELYPQQISKEHSVLTITYCRRSLTATGIETESIALDANDFQQSYVSFSTDRHRQELWLRFHETQGINLIDYTLRVRNNRQDRVSDQAPFPVFTIPVITRDNVEQSLIVAGQMANTLSGQRYIGLHKTYLVTSVQPFLSVLYKLIFTLSYQHLCRHSVFQRCRRCGMKQ